MTIQINKSNFLHLFIKWSWFFIIIAAIFQCLLFQTVENFFGVIICLIAWKLGVFYVLNKHSLFQFPLSSLLIIGFLITQFYLPITFTLLEGKPLVFNLKFPNDVFLHNLLAVLTILSAHQLYKHQRISRSFLFSKFQANLFKINIFNTITNKQVWIIGFIGLLSFFFIYFIFNINSNSNNVGFLVKFIEGFFPFAFAPYFIFIKRMYNKQANFDLKTKWYISGYTILLFIASLGSNSRGHFMIGFSALGIGYLLGLLLGFFKSTVFTKKNILIVFIIFWLITGPLVDLGIAMVIVRGHKNAVSSRDLVSNTIKVFNDKDEIQLYKSFAIDKITDWDEHYFDNIFLSRFSNLKFNDASLIQYNKLKKVDPLMTEYSINRVLSVFPEPLMKILMIDVDKSKTISSSFGDYLYYRASGASDALGSRKLGQFAGVSMASFGWWYLMLLFVFIMPIYFLFDLFVIHSKNKEHIRFSFCGILNISFIFTFISLSSNSENVINILTYILRGWIQTVFLFVVVYTVSRMITKIKVR